MCVSVGATAVGWYVHGDGHSPFVVQFDWFFGSFFLVACIIGVYCALQQLTKSRYWRSNHSSLGPTLLGSAALGLPLYLLGGLAGDLYYFRVIHRVFDFATGAIGLIVGMIGMAVALVVVAGLVGLVGAVEITAAPKVKEGHFVKPPKVEKGGWAAPKVEKGGWAAPKVEKGGWAAPKVKKGGWAAPKVEKGGWE